MSTPQMAFGEVTAPAATVDLKLEVVVIPVSDVDRTRRFYEGLGWRVDGDFTNGPDWRAVQMTPPGSPCSIHFGKGITLAEPGSIRNLYLTVSDLVTGRAELIARGADVSEPFHFTSIGSAPLPGPHPDGRSYSTYATFSDPDGNSWLLQEITTRLPGRGFSSLDVATLTDLLKDAEKRPRPVRTGRADAPLVRLVCGLHRRARGRPATGGRGCGRHAPRRRHPAERSAMTMTAAGIKAVAISATVVFVVIGGAAVPEAQGPQAGIRRVDLQRHDLGVTGREVVQVRVEFDPRVEFKEQLAPRETFHGYARETPWTPLHLGYFNGYAMWTHYNLPFLLGEPASRRPTSAAHPRRTNAQGLVRAVLRTHPYALPDPAAVLR